MSKTDSLHYELCKLGAKWLKNRMRCTYSAVEICTVGENIDVFGIRYGYESFNIEVKTSHSDFLADRKKWIRNKGSEWLQAGLFILLSIMRRENIKPQIFDYRGTNNTIKEKK